MAYSIQKNSNNNNLHSVAVFLTSLIGYIYVTHALRAMQSHALSGEGISCGLHTYFLTTQGHGGPPQMSYQLNAGATSETTRTLKTINNIHSHIHSNKTDMRRMIMMVK